MTWSRRRFWLIIWLLTAGYWLCILTLTHLPPSRLPTVHFSDKLEHFTAYSLLAGLLHLSTWPKKRSLWKVNIGVLITALVYGALDELTQPYFHRTCDLQDWLADAAGVGAMLFVMSIAYALVRKRTNGAEVHMVDINQTPTPPEMQ